MRRSLFRKIFFTYLCVGLLFSKEASLDLLPSAPEQIASLSSGESVLVAGLVNHQSGQVCARIVDLIARGAENVALSRTFVTPTVYPLKTFGSAWDQYNQGMQVFLGLSSQYRGKADVVRNRFFRQLVYSHNEKT